MKTRSYELDTELAELERRLGKSLHPVNPSPDFVGNLQRRLSSPPPVFVEKRTRALWILVVLAGMITGLLILWISGRKR
ncbi:MAG TPA: hypothetical protein VIO61_12630 [Anaerolineaceae bacterium]